MDSLLPAPVGAFPTLRPFQITAHESLRRGFAEGHRCQMVMAPTGAGKCLGFDTPILMADGSIRAVQDVNVGDRLMGPDGTGRNVLALGRGRELMYRVIPTKGDAYICNASHILALRKTPGSDGIVLADGTRLGLDADYVEVTASVLARSNATAKHCLKGWRAPLIAAFERGIDDEYLLPPYILGAWLGDGTRGKAQLSKPPCKMVEEWIAYGMSVGYGCRNVAIAGVCPTWLLSNGRDGRNYNHVATALEIAGVLFNKHVPDDYKFGSVQTRRQVLAGLIDSDGHVDGSFCDWITKDARLAQDFAFLCRSLGLACYVSYVKKGIRSTGFEGWYWRCGVSGDLGDIPMRDKCASERNQKKRHLVHGLRIEAIGEGDYYGFMLDGDGLFLLGDFTVTHNTILSLNIIREALARGKRAIFVCDRTTLINQTSEVADRFGLDHGVIQADHWRAHPWKPFQIASAQTLARRQWPACDVIVVDEAHTQLKAWTEHIQVAGAAVIGLSATPFSRGLGKLFTRLINATTMAELVGQGILTPMRVLSCTQTNMTGAATAGGEWTDAAAAERGLQIVGDVVAEWIRHGENRKTIVFGATIAHCEELCRQFREQGVPAALFTSNTDAAERKVLLRDFTGEDAPLRILISVEALAKGFDAAAVSCVVDCRPLRKSLSTAIQMWGRGLRCSPGKVDLTLLDHSNNIVRFAEDFERVYHDGLDSLDSGEKLDREIRRDDDEKPLPACPKCGYRPCAKRCMSCGHERQSTALMDTVHGQMREVMIGRRKLADDQRHLWDQVAAYAREHSTPDKRQGRAWHLFRDITGKHPPRGWHVDFTRPVPITAAVGNEIRRRNIAYSKRPAT